MAFRRPIFIARSGRTKARENVDSFTRILSHNKTFKNRHKYLEMMLRYTEQEIKHADEKMARETRRDYKNYWQYYRAEMVAYNAAFTESEKRLTETEKREEKDRLVLAQMKQRRESFEREKKARMIADAFDDYEEYKLKKNQLNDKRMSGQFDSMRGYGFKPLSERRKSG